MKHRLSISHALASLFVSGCLFAVMLVSASYLYLSPKLPAVDVLREAKMQIPLRIYSQNGELIGEFGEKLRTPIEMTEVPQQFVHAILAAEDDRFLQHKGVDLAGLLRAAGQLFMSGEIRTGGSTITMQVARNFFLSREKTFLRKFNEILLALQIERELSKNEILELYINKIYLGKRAYGFEAAAAVYYGKKLNELDLAQLATLAGLPKAPSSNNPINNPAKAILRRNWILGRMEKLGYIDEQAYTQASNQGVTAKYHGPKLALDAGYVAEMARAEAIDKLGTAAYTDGYKVVTSIDGKLQRSAETAVYNGLSNYDNRHGYRGAESRIDTSDESTFIDRALAELNRRASVYDLQPAVVMGIETAQSGLDEEPDQGSSNAQVTTRDSGKPVQRLQLLLSSGERITLDWQSETQKLRGFISENRRTAAITDISSILQRGDLVRIKAVPETEKTFTLAQLPAASAALVAIDPKNGAIRALVGGLHFRHSKFNRATQARRQPGSNFKPFVYAAALENGFTAATLINDAPIVFNDAELESDWRPENSSGKFYGPTTLRRALYLSRNLVSVRLLRELGIGKAIRYLEQLQLSSATLPRDLSLSLGSYAMTPLETASAYATIANGGFRVDSYLVDHILDRSGNVIFKSNPVTACEGCERNQRENPNDQELTQEQQTGISNTESLGVNGLLPGEMESLDALLLEDLARPPVAPRVMDARVAFIIDSILQDVIRRGTGTRARELGRNDLAGKTGTTNGPTDAWFSGYHPQLVASAWLGFDDNSLLGTQEYGGSAALPVWIDFMRDALAELPEQKRKRPAGITSIRINRLTGKPANTSDTDTIFEYFLEEYIPEQQSRRNENSKPNVKKPSYSEELF